MKLVLLVLFFLSSGIAAEFRGFSGKAKVLEVPKKGQLGKNDVADSKLVRAHLLVTELIDSYPKDYAYNHLTGKIEAQKKYNTIIRIEKSSSLKKDDEIYFIASWTCDAIKEICSDKEWRKVTESEAKTRFGDIQ